MTLRPKGLGRTRGLGSGRYRLCLGSGALSLLRKPRKTGSRDARASPPPALRLSLLSVRRCGHADSFFFLELGRSAPTGPGELWLQAPDAVVAQSIHETVLAAMKRLGGGAAGARAEPLPRESPTSASRPPSSRPLEILSGSTTQSSSLDERAEKTALKSLARLGPPPPPASHPQGLDLGRGYITMQAGRDYEPMRGGEASSGGGYVVMAPPGSAHNDRKHRGAAPRQDPGGPEYVPMSCFPPEPVSSFSQTPPPNSGTGELRVRVPDAHRGIGGSLGLAGAAPRRPPSAELAGDYVCIGSAGKVGGARSEHSNRCLNYVDLDLVPPLAAPSRASGTSPHSYACIEF